MAGGSGAGYETNPAPDAASDLYVRAVESQTVASQAKGQPDLQGITVTPSTRLLSALKSPGGSKMEGTPTVESVLLTRSLIVACLG